MNVLIYIIIVLVIILASSITMFIIRKKQVKKLLDELELKYNSIKSVPLAFKLNKAVALSRVNEDMSQHVETCKKDFDEIQDQLKDCSVLLAEVDDLLYGHKTKSAKRMIENLSSKMNTCEIRVQQVNDVLEEILQQENEQRIHINELKERFRAIKRHINERRQSFSQSYEYLESEITNIEKRFSKFEEWMFASEFNKSADEQNEIEDCLIQLEQIVEVLPSMYEKAKGFLPQAIDEVRYAFSQAKQKGVLLEHLEVIKNLDVISDMLKNDLTKLRNGSPENVNDDLGECEKRIEQLKEQIEKEEGAFDEVDQFIQGLFDRVRAVNNEVETINELYLRVHERFGFENWSSLLKDVSSRLEVLNDMQRKLDKVIANKKVPYTTMLIAFKELQQSTHDFVMEVDSMHDKLNSACSDEERAKKQLIKLQLIMNEIRVKISKHHLPSVSEQYEEDLCKGVVLVKDVKVILNNSPLDVTRLNTLLRESIDFIYTLYNNVNNLVGMAIMVENTIVFGNRFRSRQPELDSELTRAELCFRNGQYTKALKIGIQCIEKLYPGAYEKLITNKDMSIMNLEQ